MDCLPGQNEGLENPIFENEEEYYKFFSGIDNDEMNENGVSNMNKLDNLKKDLNKLLKNLKEEELEKEASLVKNILIKHAGFNSLEYEWLDWFRGFPIVEEYFFDKVLAKQSLIINHLQVIFKRQKHY